MTDIFNVGIMTQKNTGYQNLVFSFIALEEYRSLNLIMEDYR